MIAHAIMLGYATLRFALLCHTMSCHALLCDVTMRFVTLRFIMLRRVTLCHVMLCCIITCHYLMTLNSHYIMLYRIVWNCSVGPGPWRWGRSRASLTCTALRGLRWPGNRSLFRAKCRISTLPPCVSKQRMGDGKWRTDGYFFCMN